MEAAKHREEDDSLKAECVTQAAAIAQEPLQAAQEQKDRSARPLLPYMDICSTYYHIWTYVVVITIYGHLTLDSTPSLIGLSLWVGE